MLTNRSWSGVDQPVGDSQDMPRIGWVTTRWFVSSLQKFPRRSIQAQHASSYESGWAGSGRTHTIPDRGASWAKRSGYIFPEGYPCDDVVFDLLPCNLE
jgi:hypothetical protein